MWKHYYPILILIILNTFHYSIGTQKAMHNLKSIMHVTLWEFLAYEHTMFLREIYPKEDTTLFN